jgi:hypothetical protein
MAQQITQQLLQNGNVIGLKLTGAIVNVVNNIDEELNRKADNDDFKAVQDEVKLKPSIEDVKNLMKTVTDRYDDEVAEVKQAMETKAEQSAVADLSDKVQRQYEDIFNNYLLNWRTWFMGLRNPPDFTLSNPPTRDEVEHINRMSVGGWYTINGGSLMNVFREPFELPPAEG